MPSKSLKTSVIRIWKVMGLLQRPKSMMRLIPMGVKAVFHWE